MDPITAVANAIIAACALGQEYTKFLQTPAGQEVARVQLKDLSDFKELMKQIGASATKLIEGATKSGK